MMGTYRIDGNHGAHCVAYAQWLAEQFAYQFDRDMIPLVMQLPWREVRILAEAIHIKKQTETLEAINASILAHLAIHKAKAKA